MTRFSISLVRLTIGVVAVLSVMIALATAAAEPGKAVSDDFAASIRGGCPGYFTDKCTGEACGSTTYIAAGNSQNADDEPCGPTIECGGTTECADRSNCTQQCGGGS